ELFQSSGEEMVRVRDESHGDLAFRLQSLCQNPNRILTAVLIVIALDDQHRSGRTIQVVERPAVDVRAHGHSEPDEPLDRVVLERPFRAHPGTERKTGYPERPAPASLTRVGGSSGDIAHFPVPSRV